MDYLKEWKNQQYQSDHPNPAKIPKLLLEPPHQQQASESALPLFLPEPCCRTNNLSALPDSTKPTSRYSNMIGLFSLTQWQELELQALIFKYMLAGAPVPAELLQPIKKSIFESPSLCYPHNPLQHYQHYQSAMLQSGYWGRAALDPEPGRCRRTDGKKWRCSKDVVAGQKYCDRHMHRGRNRSRKPVEIPTSSATGGGLNTARSIAAMPMRAVSSSGNHFSLTGMSPSTDLLHLNRRCPESEARNQSIFQSNRDNVSCEAKTDGQVLRHFFDDWPKSQHDPNGTGSSVGQATSSNFLSISIQADTNPTSDFSLKLATGANDESDTQEKNTKVERHEPNWGVGWSSHQMSSMGGPLAEALRASTSNSSPMTVLPNGSASETSSIST